MVLLATWFVSCQHPLFRANETHLLNLFKCVAPGSKDNHPKGSRETQWREEDVFVSFSFAQLSEKVQTELGIGCAERAHCGTALACNKGNKDLGSLSLHLLSLDTLVEHRKVFCSKLFSTVWNIPDSPCLGFHSESENQHPEWQEKQIFRNCSELSCFSSSSNSYGFVTQP